MAEPAARLRDLVAATRPRRAPGSGVCAAPWTRPALAGRLVELSGARASAALTFATALVLDAQRRGETSAWVTSRESSFFPPDVAANGVDLAALPVVRVPAAADVPRAGERLLRSGSFDLVVLDLGADARVPLPLVSRLAGLAERHDAAAVLIVEKSAGTASVSSLVSLRAEARRTRGAGGVFVCELAALRDKRRPSGWTVREERRGPDGLR
jgi:recombination protein RecA